MNAGYESVFALGYIVVEWSIRIVMLFVVPFRRSPDAARGWLLLVFFLPVPAAVLYFLIGRPTYPRWRKARSAKARELLAAIIPKIEQSPSCCRPELPENLTTAALLIEHLGLFPALADNTIELGSDYDEVIDRLVADIDRAHSHVHLLSYIFADDATGQRVIDALLRAAERGVTCRVLIDALGSRAWARRVADLLAAGGAEVALALPVSLLRWHRSRADLRNHRKIFVIDAEIGFIGSQNIVSNLSSGIVNRELVVRVQGPIVLALQAVFVADWFVETGRVLNSGTFFPHRRTSGGAVAQLLPSGPDFPVSGVERLVVALVHGARQRVIITTPYFIPDQSLMQALQTAVLRGIEVRLVVSRASDNLLVSLAQHSYYDELLGAGVVIERFRSGLLHAKHISIDDDIAVIGSTNMDIRSFVLNAEATLVIYDSSVTAQLRSEQEGNLAASDRLLPAEWNRRPLLLKLAENIARLVSPLL